ncbi:hypothetical protein [Geodermatophilus ruber]|uniref:Universal stress protein family protein n=1 Tax=Geodermatophilus ruber TaxID=504800 RepID=A0A1I4KER6_9ACTN|nr:hypothetical protein [Geodermatophilus ruber]SFL77322.1 hypothetical protein SAMN04488085_11781 [Geodermatophilus ruber]
MTQTPETSHADGIAPLYLDTLVPRREHPRLLVLVDPTAPVQPELVWALQEAARREATVLAVALLDSGAREDRRIRTLVALDAQLLRAVGQTGVHGRSRTALVDPLVFEAMAATARGGDLVVVRPHSKTVLRPAVPRSTVRRPVRTAG